jgi:polyphosphate kinase
LAIVVRDPKSGEERFARVKLPQTFPRFFQLPDSLTFVSIEEIVSANLPRLFPGMEIVQCHAFRVTRNADLSVDDNSPDKQTASFPANTRVSAIVGSKSPRGVDCFLKTAFPRSDTEFASI